MSRIPQKYIGDAETVKNKIDFLVMLTKELNNVTSACEKMNMGRSTVYDWISTDRRFEKGMENVREGLRDFAETQLMRLIKGIPELDDKGDIVGWNEKPDTAAVIFFNKTINRNRGYSEKEHEEKVSPLDLSKLSQHERKKFYELYNKAQSDDVEIIE